jgi:hypothetical protein
VVTENKAHQNEADQLLALKKIELVSTLINVNKSPFKSTTPNG